MYSLPRVSLALAGAVLLAAPLYAQQPDQSNKKVKHDQYLLTSEEIAERPAITNAYEAVRMLRPNFLKQTRKSASLSQTSETSMSSGDSRSTDPYGRGATGAYAGPVLYVDELKHQSLDELKNYRVADVVEIRYLTPNEATNRYGEGHEGGAIMLKTTRKGG
jgi:hypothetical protein